MAWQDEDGYFWYVGRVDDVIKSSGYRIGPFEIESVIMELPYVLECGVSAAPDEIRGQVVKASIVLTKGTEGTEELKKEIQDYVKKHTAPYKYPRIVVFRDELPKTISGKIMRNQAVSSAEVGRATSASFAGRGFASSARRISWRRGLDSCGKVGPRTMRKASFPTRMSPEMTDLICFRPLRRSELCEAIYEDQPSYLSLLWTLRLRQDQYCRQLRLLPPAAGIPGGSGGPGHREPLLPYQGFSEEDSGRAASG